MWKEIQISRLFPLNPFLINHLWHSQTNEYKFCYSTTWDLLDCIVTSNTAIQYRLIRWRESKSKTHTETTCTLYGKRRHDVILVYIYLYCSVTPTDVTTVWRHKSDEINMSNIVFSFVSRGQITGREDKKYFKKHM